MFAVGPTFFSARLGDHEPGDGLTLFQTTFAGASAADVSANAIGSGSGSGLTLADGSMYGTMDGTTRTKLWDSAVIGMPARSDTRTWEFFFNAEEINISPGNQIKFAQFTCSIPSIDFWLQSAAYVPNGARNIFIDMSASGNGTITVPCDVYDGTKHHIVFTNKAVSGNNDIYVDGVRVVNDLYLGAYTAANGQFQLGGASNGDTLVTYYGARARNAVMYSGASFTRLSGPEAWGPP